MSHRTCHRLILSGLQRESLWAVATESEMAQEKTSENLGTFASDIFQREEKLNPKRKRNIKQVYTYYYW